MRVLLADDHPLFRDGLATLLRARGMDVVGEASNGVEAVEKARALKPDLILMDVNMPQMTGLEATRIVKTERPETKIVILTVSDDDENLFEAIKSGAQGYLLKSLQSQAFFDLLNGVAQGEAPISRGLATKILGEFARHLQQDEAQAAPVRLAEQDPAPGAQVAVVGYPALDPRNDRQVQDAIFGGVYGVKRFQPGEVMAAKAAFINHDCSTLGGNSGSVVVEFESGRAVGLHFMGEYERENFAVKASALAELLHRLKIAAAA